MGPGWLDVRTGLSQCQSLGLLCTSDDLGLALSGLLRSCFWGPTRSQTIAIDVVQWAALKHALVSGGCDAYMLACLLGTWDSGVVVMPVLLLCRSGTMGSESATSAFRALEQKISNFAS